jgi:hypothetical protein
MTKHTEGVKFDADKLRLDLLPPELEKAVSEILAFGAKKYEPFNWCKGLKYSRVYAAARRHLMQWWIGEDIDKESGLPHLWHCACNLAFLISYENQKGKYKKFDDRRKVHIKI